MDRFNLTADLWPRLSRHKLLILTTMAVSLLAAILASQQLPVRYESKALLRVELTSSQQPAMLDDSTVAALYQRLIQPVPVEEALQKVALKRNIPDQLLDRESAVELLRRDLSITRHSPSADTLMLTCVAADPQVAQQMAAAFAEQALIVSAPVALTASQPAATALRQEVAELETRIQELEEKNPQLLKLREDAPLAPAVARHAAPNPPVERPQQATDESLSDQRYKLERQLADLDQRLIAQRQLIEQKKKSDNALNNPTYAALLTRRAELQGQRDNLLNRQGLTEKHPRVIVLSDQIAALERQMAEVRQQVNDDAAPATELRELRALESERNRLKLDLDLVTRAFNRQPAATTMPTPPAVPTPSRPAGLVKIVNKIVREYVSLKARHQTARAQLEAAPATPDPTPAIVYRLVQEACPARPQNRVPHTWVWLIAAVAGGLIGLALAFVIEVFRVATIHSARDAQQLTNLPVLAAIPQMISDSERYRRVERQRIRWALGAVVAFVAIVALSELLLVTNLLSALGSP